MEKKLPLLVNAACHLVFVLFSKILTTSHEPKVATQSFETVIPLVDVLNVG